MNILLRKRLAFQFVVLSQLLLNGSKVDAASSFQNNGDVVCEEEKVAVSGVSITCVQEQQVTDEDGSSYTEVTLSRTCSFGDKLKMTGQMRLYESLPSSEMCVTVKTCYLGRRYMCQTQTGMVDLCTSMNMEASDEDEDQDEGDQNANGDGSQDNGNNCNDNNQNQCPQQGLYTFDYTIQLDSEDNSLRHALGSHWGFSEYITVHDCYSSNDFEVNCQTSFSSSSGFGGSGSSKTTSTVCFGGFIVALVFTAWLWTTNRRICCMTAAEGNFDAFPHGAAFEIMEEGPAEKYMFKAERGQ